MRSIRNFALCLLVLSGAMFASAPTWAQIVPDMHLGVAPSTFVEGSSTDLMVAWSFTPYVDQNPYVSDARFTFNLSLFFADGTAPVEYAISVFGQPLYEYNTVLGTVALAGFDWDTASLGGELVFPHTYAHAGTYFPEAFGTWTSETIDGYQGQAFGAGGFVQVVVTQAPAPVPEPQTYALLLAGLGLLGFEARRRKRLCVVRGFRK